MAVVALYPPNPSDGVTTYQRLLIERSPNAGAAPSGAWAQIVDLLIDSTGEATYYLDTSSATDSWHRWRWANTALTAFSGYSDPLQVGDSQPRQWLVSDVPDLDVTTARWQSWIDQALIDLYTNGIWKYARTTLTPVDNTEYYGLPAEIRDVFSVEYGSNDSYVLHMNWLTDGDWAQHGRQVRIFEGASAVKMVVHGKAEFRNVGELTNDYFVLLKVMVMKKYLDWRLMQRANFFQWPVLTPKSDVGPQDLRNMITDLKMEIATRVAALALPEPIVPIGR